jgi:uncharacterized protein (TIGR04141 family)
MASKQPTNKLSIYLIKKDYTDYQDIIKDRSSSLKTKTIRGIGIFYYGDSHTFIPPWIKKFFGTTLDDIDEIYSASAKGILLVDIEIKDERRTFALAFGYGWQLLNLGVYEERFGLKTALSIIDPDNLRKIDKKNMVTVPKDTSEQLSKSGIAADFGIDIEQDLIRSITGRSIDDKIYGKYVSGKDSLCVSVKINSSSIKQYLKVCYEKYLSDDYKKNFDWIDQIAEIKDVKLTNELDAKIIENMKSNRLDKTWMAVPEVVDWDRVSGFRYFHNTDEELREDIDISSFMSCLTDEDKQNISIEYLKKHTIECVGSQTQEILQHWSAYSCIYCEEQDTDEHKTYILSSGKWYEIEQEFARTVNAEFLEHKQNTPSITLPPYEHNNENEYNVQVAEKNSKYYCMDRKLINYGGSRSRIEFCDLMTADKKIIHVKRYGGSSVLSHLFFQGLVSGEMFLRDAKFRMKVSDELPDKFKLSKPNQMPKATDFEIIYGIISSDQNELDLPFFSKVSFRNAKNRLDAFGYSVFLLKIPKK